MRPPPLAIRNATLLASPDATPVEHATVVVREGRISAVGVDATIPPGAQVVSGEGGTVVAGFWNAHVHFTEERWRSAARAPAAALEPALREMLTSRGFTSVVDTGSDPRSTLPLRQRVESGEVVGPSILTAGPSVFPPQGIPYYLQGSIPFWRRGFVPKPSTPAAAERFVRKNIARGADLLKLFTGSYVARGKVRTMPEPIARAAADVAHAHGQLVYSHPSNLEGTRIAVRSGVDVLAHPPDTTEGVDAAVIQEMVDHRMAMTPTLKMFARTVSAKPEYLDPILDVVRQFRARGGTLLFGTDVGYMTDPATEEEFQLLARAGADARSILRMLTTAPADRFGRAKETGVVAAGLRADLVVLEGEPMSDVLAFARVRATIGAGRVLYARP